MSPKRKNKYRLQVLLDLRERNKKRAELELAKAIAKLKEEEEKRETLEKEKKALEKKKKDSIREMSDKLASGESVVKESSIHLNFLKKIEEDIEEKEKEIEEQKENIERAKERIREAKREYIDACQALQVMEKHKELWEKKEAKKLSLAQQKEFNELGNIIHQLKKGQ